VYPWDVVVAGATLAKDIGTEPYKSTPWITDIGEVFNKDLEHVAYATCSSSGNKIADVSVVLVDRVLDRCR
jgi:hypothetical protein